MATVVRVEKTKNYTVMSNFHLNDKNLSFKAKGLLSYMLSLPDDWDYTLEGLSKKGKDGIDSVRTAVHELEEAGYLRRERLRDEKGRLTVAEYTLSERPIQKKTEKPTLENPTQVNPTQQNTNNINNIYNLESLDRVVIEDIDNNKINNTCMTEADFDVFWSAYPRKEGKGEARKKFLKLKGISLETLLEAVERQKKSVKWTKDGGKYINTPAAWLNQERWLDELEMVAEEKIKASAPEVKYEPLVEYPIGSGNMMPRSKAEKMIYTYELVEYPPDSGNYMPPWRAQELRAKERK